MGSVSDGNASAANGNAGAKAQRPKPAPGKTSLSRGGRSRGGAPGKATLTARLASGTDRSTPVESGRPVSDDESGNGRGQTLVGRTRSAYGPEADEFGGLFERSEFTTTHHENSLPGAKRADSRPFLQADAGAGATGQQPAVQLSAAFGLVQALPEAEPREPVDSAPTEGSDQAGHDDEQAAVDTATQPDVEADDAKGKACDGQEASEALAQEGQSADVDAQAPAGEKRSSAQDGSASPRQGDGAVQTASF